jgi:ankyrin repeat protein
MKPPRGLNVLASNDLKIMTPPSNEFFEAVEAGDLAKVRAFLDVDPSLVDATNKRWRQFTALHRAAERGHTEIVRLLIARGSKVDAKDKNDSPPLTFAHKLEVIELLVANGADVNGGKGTTVLHNAVREDDLAAVQFLLAKGANVNPASRQSPLLYAIWKGYQSDNTALVETLIRHGADPNAAQPTKWNSSVLRASIDVGRSEITRLLIEAGANVNARFENGDTALHVAARLGRDKSVELLLAAGPDLNARDEENHTPLDLLSNHLKTIAILERNAQAQ